MASYSDQFRPTLGETAFRSVIPYFAYEGVKLGTYLGSKALEMLSSNDDGICLEEDEPWSRSTKVAIGGIVVAGTLACCTYRESILKTANTIKEKTQEYGSKILDKIKKVASFKLGSKTEKLVSWGSPIVPGLILGGSQGAIEALCCSFIPIGNPNPRLQQQITNLRSEKIKLEKEKTRIEEEKKELENKIGQLESLGDVQNYQELNANYEDLLQNYFKLELHCKQLEAQLAQLQPITQMMQGQPGSANGGEQTSE